MRDLGRPAGSPLRRRPVLGVFFAGRLRDFSLFRLLAGGLVLGTLRPSAPALLRLAATRFRRGFRRGFRGGRRDGRGRGRGRRGSVRALLRRSLHPTLRPDPAVRQIPLLPIPLPLALVGAGRRGMRLLAPVHHLRRPALDRLISRVLRVYVIFAPNLFCPTLVIREHHALQRPVVHHPPWIAVAREDDDWGAVPGALLQREDRGEEHAAAPHAVHDAAEKVTRLEAAGDFAVFKLFPKQRTVDVDAQTRPLGLRLSVGHSRRALLLVL